MKKREEVGRRKHTIFFFSFDMLSLPVETLGHLALLLACACVLLVAFVWPPAKPRPTTVRRRPHTPPLARGLAETLNRIAPSQNGFLPARVPAFDFGGELGRVVEVRVR